MIARAGISDPLAMLAAAVDLLESDAAFALRIQTSEPVLVAVCRLHGVCRHRSSIEIASEWCSHEPPSRASAQASILGPYIFGTRKLCEEAPCLEYAQAERAQLS